jgi:hypothetical protein
MDLNRLRKLAGLNEAITTDDIEKIMFGNLKREPEGDTEVEYDLYTDIENFIKKSTPANKAKASDSLNSLKGLKSDYPQDLMPNAKVAYRGTQFTQDDYAALIDKIDFDNFDKVPNWIKMPFTYKPRSQIQSWTTSKTIAIMFACKGTDYEFNPGEPPRSQWWSRTPYPAVIQVAVDESFILSTKLSSKIASELHGVNEKEIIRIDPSPLQGSALIHKDWPRLVRKFLYK